MQSILWFGTDYGPGDPQRWSPISVEIFLNDWLPRKIVAPVDYLTEAPTLLRAFIRYCHAERTIPEGLTEETLAAVDLCEPDYQKAIRTPHHHGAMALLERMGVLDGLDGVDTDWESGLIDENYMLRALAGAVGGMDELDRLDTDPLPDEPIEWAGISHDIVGKVTEVGDLIDGCSDAMFDVEFRTSSCRLLARIAASDPEIFRRNGAAKAAAAAICWIVGKANESFADYHRSGPQVKQLMAHFGLTGSASQRAQPMLRAIGMDWSYGDTHLRDPRLLVSSQRKRVAQGRDQYRNTGVPSIPDSFA